MIKKFFPLLFSFVSIMVFAQEKHLTIESSVLGYAKGLYPQTYTYLHWIDKTDNYIYFENNSFKIKSADAKTDKTLTLSDFTATYPDLKRVPFFNEINANEIVFQNEDYFTVFDYQNKKELTRIKTDEAADNQEYCAKNKRVAYTIDNNLYVADAAQPKMAVTHFEDKNIVSGQSIHRNEFGISKGIFWSPEGNFLAFYQKDETNVTHYPLEDITTYPSSLKNIKYPMAGQGSEKAKIGIFNVQSQQVSYLDIDTSDEHYLTNLAWSPDEKYITLAELNRGQNHMWFNVYEVQTGKKIRTVFEEQNQRWVEPETPALFLPNSKTAFLWLSEKDGFMNVYQYDLITDTSKKITDFKFVVTQILGFDAKCENVFVEATGEDPKGLQVYKINLKNGKSEKITQTSGTHRTLLNSNSTYLLDSYSSLQNPGSVSLIELKKLKSNTLFTAPNPLSDYRLGTTEFKPLKSEDGFTLESVMIKPANFDPNKKYPVLIYVYGGPHAQLVTDTWLGGTGLWMQYMAAEKDYILFTLDGRGSENRGFAFESVIHRNQGVAAMADQMVGVDYLKSLPYVDANRIAIHGWSYGGFMTSSLLVNYPNTFTTGVAGGPVTDWKYYEVMYGERYMDTPQENPEGYTSTRVHGKIKNLKGHLLIIHGSIDDTVVPQHSLTLLKEAIDNGVQLDFFTYPMHPHNVRGKDRVHLMTKVIDYVLKNN